jgi:hypothetical protein
LGEFGATAAIPALIKTRINKRTSAFRRRAAIRAARNTFPSTDSSDSLGLHRAKSLECLASKGLQ